MKLKATRALVHPYLIRRGSHFRLKDVDPDETSDRYDDPETGKAALREGIDRLRTLQEKLYANGLSGDRRRSCAP